MKFTVYGRWDDGAPIGEPTLSQINASFRPADDGVCVWVEADAPGVLQVSFEVDASDHQQALERGRAGLEEAAHAGAFTGRLIDVAVMTEDTISTWTA